jgi:mono/diheme cytochrome c family protein
LKRALCLGVAVAALSSAVIGQVRPEIPATATARGAAQARSTIDTYCVGCHNARAKAGGLALDTLPVDAVHEHADVWEAAVRKLRGRLMPPPGSRQPEQREIDTFVTWMETQLDAAALRSDLKLPVAGHVPVQRMTRTEYATAVNDLLGLELEATDVLPPRSRSTASRTSPRRSPCRRRSSISTWPPHARPRAWRWANRCRRSRAPTT